MAMGKRGIIAGTAAAAAGLVGASFFLGWDIGSVLIGLGCGLGAYLGAVWGNREAVKTGAYRQEWLNKRKKRVIPPAGQEGDETRQ